MADQQMYAQPPPTQEIRATDIPTRHKAGIWGGGITAVIALIIAIVALVLVFTYHNEGWVRWRVTSVTPSGSTASVSINNRMLYQIAPGTTAVTVSTTGGTAGDLFGIANTSGTGSASLTVSGTSVGSVSIVPGSAVQFINSGTSIIPFSVTLPMSS